MRGCAVVGALLVSIAPSVARPATDPNGVLLRVHDNGAVVVPVTLDGRGPFRFVLDTGSSRSAMSRTLATRLGYRPTGHAWLVTPSGRARVPLTHVEAVAVQSAPAVNVSPMVVPDADLARRAAADGLIGQDVLAELTYTIDYERRRLVWHDTPEPAVFGTRLPLEWDHTRVLVHLAQPRWSNAPLRLVPDTGTATIVLFAQPDRPPGLAIVPGGVVALRTLSGQHVARHTFVDELHVGEARLRSQPALLVKTPAGADLGDGLLPLHLFARVTISVPAGYLIVEPRRR